MAIVKAYKHINNSEDILRMVADNGDGTYKMLNAAGKTVEVREIVLRRWYHRTAIEIEDNNPIVPDAAVINTCRTDNNEYENLPQSVLYIIAAFQLKNYVTEVKKTYVRVKKYGEKKSCCEVYFTKKGKITLAVKQDIAEQILQKLGNEVSYSRVSDSYGWTLNYKVKFSNNFDTQWNTLSAKHIVDCF